MKLLGAWFKEDALSGIPGISMAILTRGLGMTTEEVEILMMKVRQAINSKRLHCYVTM